MGRRILGRTACEVTVLGLGGAFLSRRGQPDREEARRAVHRAFELGIDNVDSAPTNADSEEVLGYALRGVAQAYYLSTKLGGRPKPIDPRDKDVLRRSVEVVEANVAAVNEGPLPRDVLDQLQAIADLVLLRPFEEPFVLPFERPYLGPGRAGP